MKNERTRGRDNGEETARDASRGYKFFLGRKKRINEAESNGWFLFKREEKEEGRVRKERKKEKKKKEWLEQTKRGAFRERKFLFQLGKYILTVQSHMNRLTAFFPFLFLFSFSPLPVKRNDANFVTLNFLPEHSRERIKSMKLKQMLFVREFRSRHFHDVASFSKGIYFRFRPLCALFCILNLSHDRTTNSKCIYDRCDRVSKQPNSIIVKRPYHRLVSRNTRKLRVQRFSLPLATHLCQVISVKWFCEKWSR